MLTHIDFSYCKRLKTFGVYSFGNCYSVIKLKLKNCESLGDFWPNVFFFEKINYINLENCKNITKLDCQVFGKCYFLKYLNLNGCDSLKTIDKNAFPCINNELIKKTQLLNSEKDYQKDYQMDYQLLTKKKNHKNDYDDNTNKINQQLLFEKKNPVEKKNQAKANIYDRLTWKKIYLDNLEKLISDWSDF
jgi:hypothetical protein